MPLDFVAPMNALIVLLKTIPGLANEVDGVAHVYKGAVASLPVQGGVYVALAEPRVMDKATQLQQVEASYFVGFGYRIDPDAPSTGVAAAEDAIAGYLSAFLILMAAPVNRTLGGLVTNVRVEFPLAGTPQYQPLAGQEFRVLPALVWTTQQQTY